MMYVNNDDSQLKMSLEIQICDVFQFCKNTVFSTYNEISFFSYFFFLNLIKCRSNWNFAGK